MKKASELTEAEMAAKLVKGVEKDMTEQAGDGFARHMVEKGTVDNPTTQALLEERGKTHGDFTNHVRVTMRLKRVVDEELYDCKGYVQKLQGGMAKFSHIPETDHVMHEAIDMILHKIGRIVAGDPNVRDHWEDIAGYAKLVADRL